MAAIAVEGEVRVECSTCAATPGVDPSWRLTSSRPSPPRAELDDVPYNDLAAHLGRAASAR